MPDHPHRILDRAQAIQHASEIYKDQIELLEEMTDFGTNLIVRCHKSSENTLGDVIVCFVHLKQIVTMLDSVSVLLRQGAVLSAFLPSRALYEASLYLDWMLVSDREKKAMYYYVENLRDERKWALRCLNSANICENAVLHLPELQDDINAMSGDMVSMAQQRLAEINVILCQPGFKIIDDDFHVKRKGKRKLERRWYEMLGQQSIRQIAKSLGRLTEYDVFYSRGSTISHSGSHRDHLRFVNNEARLKNIRHLEDASSLLAFTINISVKSYEMALRLYRPSELPVL